MNKYFTSTLLLIASGTAAAHSHPTIDAVSHALEHAALNAYEWHPYLLGFSLVALIGGLLQARRNHRENSRRRPK